MRLQVVELRKSLAASDAGEAALGQIRIPVDLTANLAQKWKVVAMNAHVPAQTVRGLKGLVAHSTRHSRVDGFVLGHGVLLQVGDEFETCVAKHARERTFGAVNSVVQNQVVLCHESYVA